METYLRMFYFGVEKVTQAEGDFRAVLAQYHAQFQNVEIHTDSRMPDEMLAPARALLDLTRNALKQNPHFQSLPEKWQERLLENPSRIDLPKISQNAGISPGYHHSSYEFCSSFVHGSLYAMQLTENVNLQTGEGKPYFRQIADIVCGYVALAVRDFKTLFPELPALDRRVVDLAKVWSVIVQWEKLPGFDEIRSIAHRLENPDAN
jgi:hypothetical protein